MKVGRLNMSDGGEARGSVLFRIRSRHVSTVSERAKSFYNAQDYFHGVDLPFSFRHKYCIR